MSRLFKLKKWLTVPDAAKHLSVVFGEEVAEADVLQLALDGDLKLSVQLVNGAYGCHCVPVNIEEIEWDEFPLPNNSGSLKVAKNGHGRVWQNEKGSFQVYNDIKKLAASVWDLPMTGGEKIDVEFRYQFLTNGPKVTAVTMDGVFLEGLNGDLFEVQTYYPSKNSELLVDSFFHPDNFHPSGALPDDSVFVVRVEALTEFLQSVGDEPSCATKPLGTTERNNLLRLVIGMAVKGYSYSPSAKKSTTTKEIADDLADLGISIDPDTVRKYLKEAANTVLPASTRQA